MQSKSRTKFTWHRNPDLDTTMTFEADPFMKFESPHWDDKYEHVWYIDPRVNPTDDKVWVIKRIPTRLNEGVKNMGYIMPKIKIEVNPCVPDLSINIDKCYPAYWDLSYECAWELDPLHTKERTWVVKFSPAYRKPKQWKWYGIVELLIPKLDVIFISYNEPNAEANWKRVLEKAPHAKRVDGVEGIFNAHKAAAKIASTDMFYVVDGDAYLTDEWQFDFSPSIFDRDCAYVWNSRNPVNDLVYENGGVKLFPRSVLRKKRKWTTLDMFTTISNKIKVVDDVSNITAFNTDEFSTWRSAFRECVKLYTVNQMTKLNVWLTIGEDKPFGKYAVAGATAGYQFAMKHKNNQQILNNINDYRWLEEQFNYLLYA
jgi:hypothetical protein